MLLFMKSHIEAMRALIVYNAAAIDLSRALEGDPAEHWREISELLTPVTKAWCTDMGMEVTSAAVQVFGGMGYIEESGVSQHFRDMRIAPIYEGTNGIQAMDLVGRKLAMRMGGVVNEHLDRMRATADELAAAGEGFESMARELSTAVEVLAGVTDWVMTNGLASPVEALAGATPYLRIFGTVTGGWLLARQALGSAGRDRRGIRRHRLPVGTHHYRSLLRRAAPAPGGGAGADGAGGIVGALRGRRRHPRFGLIQLLRRAQAGGGPTSTATAPFASRSSSSHSFVRSESLITSRSMSAEPIGSSR
ncbi:MAG: acyl-CoA dehydrogenase [Microthrixaceae bacterium]